MEIKPGFEDTEYKKQMGYGSKQNGQPSFPGVRRGVGFGLWADIGNHERLSRKPPESGHRTPFRSLKLEQTY